MRTQAVQAARCYHINSFDVVVACDQIKKNKMYARIDSSYDVAGLYRLFVNYNYVASTFFNRSQLFETATIIYGLEKMGRYLQAEDRKYREKCYGQENGVSLSDDEMGLVIMILKIAAFDSQNRRLIRIFNALHQRFQQMVKQRIIFDLSKSDAKLILKIIKAEDQKMRNLKLDAPKLESIFRTAEGHFHKFIDRMKERIRKYRRLEI